MTATGWALVAVTALYALAAVMGLSGASARLTMFWQRIEDKGETMRQTDKHTTPETATTTAVADETVPTTGETPDTPGHDENGDGLTGGQTTADTFGDELGI